ncbi:MAG: hypothetical protein ACREQZ_11450 [Woeseiaceae bacterium]
MQGVEAGLNAARETGVCAGYPTIGVKATLIDAACHDADSTALLSDDAFDIERAGAAAGLALVPPVAQHLDIGEAKWPSQWALILHIVIPQLTRVRAVPCGRRRSPRAAASPA